MEYKQKRTHTIAWYIDSVYSMNFNSVVLSSVRVGEAQNVQKHMRMQAIERDGSRTGREQ